MLIVGGIIAGIIVGVMQISKSTFSNQADASNSSEYFGLKSELDSMFSNPFDCTASLANVTFTGSTIRTEAKDVEIWKGDQFAVRTRKFLSGTDLAFNKYGKLVVGSIKFSMPDYTHALNFPAGVSQSFKGEIRFEGTKTKLGKVSPFVSFVKPINVGFNTNSAGISTITSCSSSGIMPTVSSITTFDILVARNSINSINTLPNRFKYCTLFRVATAGEGSDVCEVIYNADTTWTLKGQLGDDPDINCKMICF